MRVLVVDDDDTVRHAVQVGLEAAGHSCDLAAGGREGLWRAQEFEYDVMLLDLTMPDLDGTEVCRRLRAAGVWTPTLMLTARSDTRDQVGGLDAGADDYLVKPFALPVLLARLRALARRGATPRSALLRCGDLSLDPLTFLCHRGNVEIALTGKEARVLEALLRRGDAWVSKSRILDLVWGPDTPADPNVVEVYVSALRRKVDRPFGVRTVESKRGLGYRLTRGDGSR